MGLLDRLRMKATPKLPLDNLYRAIVARAREPRWYTAGAVADSIDGRFDMVALIMSLVLIRLEREPDTQPQVTLTERFVDDMDSSLREIGIGDMVIGKHVGRTVAALGGRLGAYREALASHDDELLEAALARNLYRGATVDPVALRWTAFEVRELAHRIAAVPTDDLLQGCLP